MKIYRNVIACAALALAASLGVARAESATPETPAGEQPAAQPKRHQGRLATLTERLKLTEEQKTQVAAILKDGQAARQAIRQDTTTTEDVKKAKRQELMSAENAKIRALLTPEQQATFDEMAKRYSRGKGSQS